MAALRRSGATPFRGRARRFARGRPRRKITWFDAVFSSNTVATSSIVELSIATNSDLQTETLGRGTIVAMYGRMVLQPDGTGNTLSQCTGAWGICVKEADATTTTTAFSPLADGDSTIWMQHRQFSLLKTWGSTAPLNGHPAGYQDDDFVIRNPRKITVDDELVCIIHNGTVSDAPLRYQFWVRIAVALP